MRFQRVKKFLAAAVLLLSMQVLVHAENTVELLSEPIVGDIYLAKLNKFSKQSFGGSNEDVYGFLGVNRVTGAEVRVWTSNKAWSKLRGAVDEKKSWNKLTYTDGETEESSKQSAMKKIERMWDRKEVLTIPRDQLEQLHRDGDIIQVHRWFLAE